MDREELLARILDLLEDICGDEAVREEQDVDLFETGLLDSLAAMELLVEIENEFGVVIAPTEVDREEMNTVSKIVDRVSERV